MAFIETYFAFRCYVVYAMLAALGICVIILIIELIKVYLEIKLHASLLDGEEYGETWRCWPQRPTDEQREATPWNP